MPFTPLHLAVGCPIKHLAGARFSLWAFIIVNVLIDIEPGLVIFFRMDTLGYPLHGFYHTLPGALLIAAVASVAATVILWGKWERVRAAIAGLLVGAISHVALDALVHTDVLPFAPWLNANPFYTGLIEPISLVCLGITLAYGVPWLLLGVRKVTRRAVGNSGR